MLFRSVKEVGDLPSTLYKRVNIEKVVAGVPKGLLVSLATLWDCGHHLSTAPGCLGVIQWYGLLNYHHMQMN